MNISSRITAACWAVIRFFGLDKPGPDPQGVCESSGNRSGGTGAGLAGSSAPSTGRSGAIGGAAGTAGVEAIAGGGGFEMAGRSASAGNPGGMQAGAGGRAVLGMPGTASTMPLAAMIGSAGTSGNVGTDSWPNSAERESTSSSASSGCQCAVGSARGNYAALRALHLGAAGVDQNAQGHRDRGESACCDGHRPW